MADSARTRKLTILAQDPGVRFNGRLAFSQVAVPAEDLAPGPTGYRVKVVDFDASANVAYKAEARYTSDDDWTLVDPFALDSKEEMKAGRDVALRSVATGKFLDAQAGSDQPNYWPGDGLTAAVAACDQDKHPLDAPTTRPRGPARSGRRRCGPHQKPMAGQPRLEGLPSR